MLRLLSLPFDLDDPTGVGCGAGWGVSAHHRSSPSFGRMTWANAVPGTLRLHVDELDVAVPRDSKWRDDFETTISVSLDALRERLGGESGTITDAFGAAHSLSVARWAGKDPATRLVVWFSYQQADLPDGFRGSVYPDDVLARVHPGHPDDVA